MTDPSAAQAARSAPPDAPASAPVAAADRRLVLIDALRGIASLWVVLFHAHAAGHIAAVAARLPRAAVAALFEVGWVGVPIFFVLSGYVIALSVGKHRVDGRFVLRFVARRSVRLDPPYWASMAIAVAFALASLRFVPGKHYDPPTLGQVAAHVLYLQELLGIREINEVYWTLCQEIQFYLVFCLLLWAVHAQGARRGALASVFGPALAIAAAFPLLLPPLPVRGLFLPLWHGFLLGAVAYWVVAGKVGRRWFVAFAGAIGLALVRAGVEGRGADALQTAAFLATAALLLAAGLRGRMGRWLGWWPLQWLGKISYSLYLIHNPVTGAAFRASHQLLPAGAPGELVGFAFALACVLGASWLTWFVIERPSQALARRIALWRRPAGAG